MKPKLGIVCRTDMGGIAAQTIDMAKHLEPEATLVVNLVDKGRGPYVERAWPNPIHTQVTHGSKSWLTESDKLATFCDQVDVILTVETFYGELLQEIARSKGVKTVRYINPELYRPEPCDQEILSSEWERDRFPDMPVIPQAIEAPKDKIRLRTSLKTILFQGAPAMLDRNGSAIFLKALEHVKHPYHIWLRDVYDITFDQHNMQYQRHEIANNTISLANRWDIYNQDIDLLVYPRRYGGNSLTLLEAAACGIPILTTNCPPQNGWLPKQQLIAIKQEEQRNFIGGKYTLHHADPIHLAEKIDELYENPLKLQRASQMSLRLAKERNWPTIKRQWQTLLTHLTK